MAREELFKAARNSSRVRKSGKYDKPENLAGSARPLLERANEREAKARPRPETRRTRPASMKLGISPSLQTDLARPMRYARIPGGAGTQNLNFQARGTGAQDRSALRTTHDPPLAAVRTRPDAPTALLCGGRAGPAPLKGRHDRTQTPLRRDQQALTRHRQLSVTSPEGTASSLHPPRELVHCTPPYRDPGGVWLGPTRRDLFLGIRPGWDPTAKPKALGGSYGSHPQAAAVGAWRSSPSPEQLGGPPLLRLCSRKSA